MFQALKRIFASSTSTAATPEDDNSIPIQLAEDKDVIILSEIALNTEEFDELLQKHSNPKIIARLTLKGTQVSALPPVIGKFVSITQLDLSRNQISLLPWSIFYLQELEEFNLSNNYIVELPKTLGYLKKLKIFDLRDNQIQFIPSELVLLDSLNTILLEGNLTLKSPPANDIPTDVQGLRAYLLHRHNRSDAFIACRYYYTYKSHIPSLLDLTVRCIMEYKLEYLSCLWVPPSLKHHIHKEDNDKEAKLHVMKCSVCNNYFSSKKTFEVHHC